MKRLNLTDSDMEVIVKKLLKDRKTTEVAIQDGRVIKIKELK